MTATRRRPRAPSSLLGGGAVIAVAMGVMNLATYGFTIGSARLLGPGEYGALAAVMGLLMVVNVLSLGFQATGARRVSASPDELDRIEAEVMRTSVRAALVLGLVSLLAAPAVYLALRLDNPATAVLLALTAVPLTMMGATAGILQGERRWLPLAGVYLGMGLGRLGFGFLGLLVYPHTLGATAGVWVGAFVPVLVGLRALRHPSRRRRTAPAPTAGSTTDVAPAPEPAPQPDGVPARQGLLREITHNSHALLAFFALSNADVVIARTVLGDHQSGLYAAGLILAKAVLFLPQFVVVVAFPAMAAVGARRTMYLRGLALTLLIGGCATLGAWLLSGLAVTFVGGSQYAQLQPLIWAFAGVGTLLASIQLMVYEIVARQHQRSVLVVWTGLVVLVAVSPLTDSVATLVATVAGVQALVLTAVLVSSVWLVGDHTPEAAAREPVRTGV